MPNSRAEILGEALGAFELRRRLRRPEMLDAGRVESVCKPGDERRLGADDDEVDGVVRAKANHGRVVGDVERDALGDAPQCRHSRAHNRASSTAGWRLSAQASACSRPPEPISRTFIAAGLSKARGLSLCRALAGRGSDVSSNRQCHKSSADA